MYISLLELSQRVRLLAQKEQQQWQFLTSSDSRSKDKKNPSEASRPACPFKPAATSPAIVIILCI